MAVRILRALNISIHAPREGSDRDAPFWGPWTRHFYPRSPRGERPAGPTTSTPSPKFLSTLPARGATQGKTQGGDRDNRFLSTLPARGATWTPGTTLTIMRFLSTLPARGATVNGYQFNSVFRISIHAPREGSDPPPSRSTGPAHISIHAPREGSDPTCLTVSLTPSNFYPRSPRGERPTDKEYTVTVTQFLSTLPARGATLSWYADSAAAQLFLSTLPARGATCPARTPMRLVIFLSTLPARGATKTLATRFTAQVFLSTLPARGATDALIPAIQEITFLSTLPARGATGPL